jgi:quercetin dioxygenase-like cupin family protein
LRVEIYQPDARVCPGVFRRPNGDKTKEVAMRQRLKWLVLFSALITVSTLFYARKVSATPPSGFVGTTLAKGTLSSFEVFNHAVLPNSSGDDDERKVWLSMQKTKGESDLYVQSNVWQPGGSTGWHSHPGHSLIIVTEGTVTDYESDDPACKPQVYTQGMSFVDSGGSHSHIVRNESTTVAATIAVQLIPAGATRRIDAPAPPNCPNIQ